MLFGHFANLDNHFSSLTSIKDLSSTKGSRDKNHLTFLNTEIKVPPYLKMATKPTFCDVSFDTYVVSFDPSLILVINGDYFFVSHPSNFINQVTTQQYALFSQQFYLQFLNEAHGLRVAIFELYLDVNSTKTVELPFLKLVKNGFIVKVYPQHEFEHLFETDQLFFLPFSSCLSKKIAYLGKRSKAHHLNDGRTVLSWSKLKEGHPGKLTMWFTDLMNMCISKGFGSRGITVCRRINFYAGQRLSCQSQPSPVEGLGSQQL